MHQPLLKNGLRLGALALLAAVETWRRCFDACAIMTNFHRVTRLNAAAALALAGYAAWHLAP